MVSALFLNSLTLFLDRDAKTMFIKGLSFSADEGSVQAVFPAAYQVRIPLNEEGRPKG